MNFKHLLCSVACAVTALPALACFTVYDRANRVVYNAQTPPVDMRYPIHQTLPRVFPGGHMVFGDSTDCPANQAMRAGADPALPLSIAAAQPVAQPMDSRDMVITELRDPKVFLYGRLNQSMR